MLRLADRHLPRCTAFCCRRGRAARRLRVLDQLEAWWGPVGWLVRLRVGWLGRSCIGWLGRSCICLLRCGRRVGGPSLSCRSVSASVPTIIEGAGFEVVWAGQGYHGLQHGIRHIHGKGAQDLLHVFVEVFAGSLGTTVGNKGESRVRSRPQATPTNKTEAKRKTKKNQKTDQEPNQNPRLRARPNQDQQKTKTKNRQHSVPDQAK